MGANDKYVCCICGKEFIGWGNNPYPVVKDEGARCCDDCNSAVVIPMRIAELDKRYVTEFVGYDDEGLPIFETHEAEHADS